jgi:hypothetical protein
MAKGGNTTGRVVGETPSASVPASQANPELDPLDALQMLLDIGGLIPGAGVAADLINAVISVFRGDFLGALFSAGAAVPLVGDAAGVAKIAAKIDKYREAVRVVRAKVLDKLPAGLKKQLEDYLKKVEDFLANLGKKEEPPKKPKEAPKKSEGDTQVKPRVKKKLKCGESGSYKELGKKDAGVTDKRGVYEFNRDHIPSKAALKARAEQILNRPLTGKEKAAIDNQAFTVAIPSEMHKEYSPTHSQSTQDAIKDATPDPKTGKGGLADAAKRDVKAMKKGFSKKHKSCGKKYAEATKEILNKTNADYDKWLVDTVNAVKNAK